MDFIDRRIVVIRQKCLVWIANINCTTEIIIQMNSRSYHGDVCFSFLPVKLEKTFPTQTLKRVALSKAELLLAWKTVLSYQSRTCFCICYEHLAQITGNLCSAVQTMKATPSLTLLLLPFRNAPFPLTQPAVKPPKNRDCLSSVRPCCCPHTETAAPTGSTAPPRRETLTYRSKQSLTKRAILSKEVWTVCTRCTDSPWRLLLPNQTGKNRHLEPPVPNPPTPTPPFALTRSSTTANIRRKSPRSTKTRSESA